MQALAFIDKDIRHTSRSATTTTTTTHDHQTFPLKSCLFCVACCETLAVDMNVDGAGAAKRRRERRLRSWWRHERMSIACALAEALHHSSGAPKYDKRVVEDAKHGAVRGQTAATRVREATGMQYFTFDDEGKPVAGERFRPMVMDLRRIPVHVEEPSPRRPCAADGGTAGGSGHFLSPFLTFGCRAGYRSAQACPSWSCCSARGSV